MPYEIMPENGKFKVVTKGTDKVHGTFATRAAAEAQMRALYANANPDDEAAKSLDYSYVKSLGLIERTDDEWLDLLCVKSIGKNEIRHYPFLWGNPAKLDVESEYFTPQSNYWDDVLKKSPRALTWDHAQDKSMHAPVIIGQTVDWGNDEIGRWAISKLDESHEYRKAIDALMERRALGSSSDTAPQYTERVKTGKSVWLKTWPWFATALTHRPAEPRMLTDGSPEYLKSIGILLPDAPDMAWQWNVSRIKLLKAKNQIGD